MCDFFPTRTQSTNRQVVDKLFEIFSLFFKIPFFELFNVISKTIFSNTEGRSIRPEDDHAHEHDSWFNLMLRSVINDYQHWIINSDTKEWSNIKYKKISDLK